ncbi:MAG: putative Glycerol kinase [Streblomastix strix]|uniref:glycerol kinase n=1 Tax=Streblomastix strix TaxID=222440 RepID=A0A5J4X2Z1_9EUKA|nr:MAG: putative Glycerol kinase [Streblomastix strix]
MAKRQLLLSIDHGTTSSRVIVFDRNGKSFPQIQTLHKQIFPHAGHCEHDGQEIIMNIISMLKQTVQDIIMKLNEEYEICGVGITNQRETCICWDKFSGKPLHNAIVWHDTRTNELVDEYISKYGDKFAFAYRSGLPFSTYFSALKFVWLVRNVPEISKAISENRCMFGTMDSWIIYNLTGGAQNQINSDEQPGIHITDVTNASRTMLFNIKELKWDPWLCEQFGVPMSILPEVRSSSEIYGRLRLKHFNLEGLELLEGIPIAGCLGDQQSALLGHKALRTGDAKVTYGTGCFLLMNTGHSPIFSTHGLLTTVAFQFGKNLQKDKIITDSSYGPESLTPIPSISPYIPQSPSPSSTPNQYMIQQTNPFDSAVGQVKQSQEKKEYLQRKQRTYYALEGSVAIAGAAVQWMVKNFKVWEYVVISGFEQPHDIGTLAKQVEDTGDIVFVPSFQGFFAPRWRSDVRATFVGISLQAEPAHFARALEEAIALQVREVLVSMGEDRQNERVKQKMEKEKESEKQNVELTETNEKEDKKQEEIEKKQEKEEQEKLKKERIKERNEQLKLKQKLDNEKLKDEERNQIQKEIQKYLPQRVVVDGGPTEDEFLMQLQADFLNAEVVRPQNIEATALGAAMAAGLAVFGPR